MTLDSSSGAPPPSGKGVTRTAPEGTEAGSANAGEHSAILRKNGASPDQIDAILTVSRSGPLPSVQEFEGYDRVCPGAARDILDMARAQQKHVHFIEKLEAFYPYLGQIVAVLIFALWLGAIVWLASLGFAYTASALAAGTGAIGVLGILMRWRDAKQPAGDEARGGGPRPSKKRRR